MDRYEKAMADVEEPTRVPITWWKPPEGGIIGGVVRALAMRETSYGDQKVIELLGDDAEIYGRTVNGQMEAEIENNEVEIGDRIALKYFGKRTSEKTGRSYNTYGIKVLEKGVGAPAAEKSPPATGTFVDEDDIPF